jgi:hypothetical protein
VFRYIKETENDEEMWIDQQCEEEKEVEWIKEDISKKESKFKPWPCWTGLPNKKLDD